MHIKRQVYGKLSEWKNNRRHSTLEINGARQVGKTYIVNRFADENFRRKIYINLFELSGEQFQECYKRARQWEPESGKPRPASPLHDAFKMFAPDFEDSEDTVIIIDEIQESAEIYNRIREFTRKFHCRFIVTGSYLGRVYEPDFRYSSGDVTKVQIYTLSFEEFLEASDSELYQRYQLVAGGVIEKELHQLLKAQYDIYCIIGGYPQAVGTYIETENIEKSREELVRIIDTFMNESIRYFSDILDTKVFTDIFLAICRILNREKRGLEEDSISEELQKLVTRDYSSNVSKAACNRAIGWLYFSGIIGLCGKIPEMDIMSFKAGARCYFMDLGVASYYLGRIGALDSDIAGMLNENYVYINLKKRQDFPEEIAFETPAFATFKQGEIDFLVQPISGAVRYGIEVKAGRQSGNTVRKALDAKKITKLLYLKGDTKGGVREDIITLPIYLLEQFRF